jgi:hypothetical protein
MLMHSLALPEEHLQLGMQHPLRREIPFDPRIFMEDRESIKSGIHYHIRWSDSSLDWNPFSTEEEATILAG